MQKKFLLCFFLNSLFPTPQNMGQIGLEVGLPWWLRFWERICLPCRRSRFDPWVGKIPWRGNGYPLQNSCLENSMDRGAWQATVHGVAWVGHSWVTKQAHSGWSGRIKNEVFKCTISVWKGSAGYVRVFILCLSISPGEHARPVSSWRS